MKKIPQNDLETGSVRSKGLTINSKKKDASIKNDTSKNKFNSMNTTIENGGVGFSYKPWKEKGVLQKDSEDY